MDPLTIAAICSLVLKGQAAVTAVPQGTNCRQIEQQQQANAARANAKVDSESDREAIGRVAYHEAGNQGDRGIAAVVYTIINRIGSGRWGGNVSAVLNSPKQFEPVMRAGGDWRRLPPAPDAMRARIDAIVGLALRGDLADETGGALYFQNPRIVAAREKAGLVSRGLTNFGGQTPSAVIGDHSFYTGPRVTVGQRGGVRTAQLGSGEDADRNAYIEGGGALFVDGRAEAFDPAQQDREDGASPPNRPKILADNDRRGVPDEGRNEPRGGEPPRDAAPKPEPDSGGMFVLPDGRTSASPKPN